MDIEETRKLLILQQKEYEESLKIDRAKAKRKLEDEIQSVKRKVYFPIFY